MPSLAETGFKVLMKSALFWHLLVNLKFLQKSEKTQYVIPSLNVPQWLSVLKRPNSLIWLIRLSTVWAPVRVSGPHYSFLLFAACVFLNVSMSLSLPGPLCLLYIHFFWHVPSLAPFPCLIKFWSFRRSQLICDFLGEPFSVRKSKPYSQRAELFLLSEHIIQAVVHCYVALIVWLSPGLDFKYPVCFAYTVFSEAPVQCLASGWPSLNIC